MRIVVNDYSGHPFQVQLSRELARRGHDVLHLHFAEFQTPKGELTLRADDARSLQIEGVTLGEPFAKNTFVKRRRQEIRYARKVAERLERFAPDIVVGCNNPLDAQKIIQNWCSGRKAPFVFWLQDLYSVAITKVLGKKFALPGAIIGRYYQQLERSMLARSAAIIAISDDFTSQLRFWGVDCATTTVIPNWAPLDALQVRPKVNDWSRRHGFADKKLVVYTGTLGFKHNPELLVALAERLALRGDAGVLVVSEGPGAEFVRAEAAAKQLDNLIVLPFQPIEDYSDVLGAADILVSIIEPDAAQFSVPSKVMSYLCAGRALVLSVPTDNLAAKTVVACKAGLALPPGDAKSFVESVERLLDDPVAREAAGKAARQYAERTFDIGLVADRFEAIFNRLAGTKNLDLPIAAE